MANAIRSTGTEYSSSVQLLLDTYVLTPANKHMDVNFFRNFYFVFDDVEAVCAQYQEALEQVFQSFSSSSGTTTTTTTFRIRQKRPSAKPEPDRMTSSDWIQCLKTQRQLGKKSHRLSLASVAFAQALDISTNVKMSHVSENLLGFMQFLEALARFTYYVHRENLDKLLWEDYPHYHELHPEIGMTYLDDEVEIPRDVEVPSRTVFLSHLEQTFQNMILAQVPRKRKSTS